MKPFNLMEYIRKFPVYYCRQSAGFRHYCFPCIKLYSDLYGQRHYQIFQQRSEGRGLAPDGTEIDVSEIYSAEVLNQVFENLDLDYSKHNIDDLRSRVTVEPVRTQGEAALEEAKTSLGEEMEEMPVEYVVSFHCSYQRFRR